MTWAPSRIVVLSGGFRAVTDLDARRTEWVPEDATGAKQEAPVTRVAKLVQCPKCRRMKPASAPYHAPLFRDRDEMKCKHGEVYWTDCTERIPPRCCWESES